MYEEFTTDTFNEMDWNIDITSNKWTDVVDNILEIAKRNPVKKEWCLRPKLDATAGTAG